MKRVLSVTGVGFVIVLMLGCSPDTSSQNQNARQGVSTPIKPNVAPPSSPTPHSEAAVSPAVAEAVVTPLLQKPSVEPSLSVKKPQGKAVSLQQIRATAWPAVPTTTELETSTSRYLVSLEMYRRALEVKRESLELARREGVMQSKEYAAMIERYRQGIRAYRLGYARYKQRQTKP